MGEEGEAADPKGDGQSQTMGIRNDPSVACGFPACQGPRPARWP